MNNLNIFLDKHDRTKQDLNKLTNREIIILKLRTQAKTYKEIAKIFKVTKVRIRQIESKALRKLGILQYHPGPGKYHSPFNKAINKNG